MENLDTRLIKPDYGADPSSVAYDAIEHARARNRNVVIIDTSGRQVTNTNLINQLIKIKRTSQPHLTVMIGDSLAGNDLIEQATEFNKRVGIDATIITKVDADDFGGAALSIANITQKPILFMGVGQLYGDLVPYDPEWFVQRILGDMD
jgi:fused signal recognition particle receptor